MRLCGMYLMSVCGPCRSRAMQKQRSQHKNKAAALQLLASRLEDAER